MFLATHALQMRLDSDENTKTLMLVDSNKQ